MRSLPWPHGGGGCDESRRPEPRRPCHDSFAGSRAAYAMISLAAAASSIAKGVSPPMSDPSWSKHLADVLRRNDIRTFATVPDYIVSHVLEHLWADPECKVVTVTREEEGVGLLSGAWLAGCRGALLMQNSGLGNC